MVKRFHVAWAIAAYLLPGVANAHHGLDFIVVQTAHLPTQGSLYAIGRLDYIAEDEDEIEFEPALLYGATDWLTLELHAHYEKMQGESTEYESLAPAIHFRLTPRDQQFLVGLSLEYEFADDSAEDDVVEVAAIFGYEFSGWMASANILLEKQSKLSGEWGYAAGLRRSFRERHGLGVELIGSFESDGSSEMVLGYYGELSERFSLNAGVGTGLSGGPNWSARTAFIWQFR